ncbi:hypothetical protein KFU94_18895 [Chloroflexi bacterium TSY]|nr:hypothetical protein [Chloroflexi bacterium TSY]
MSFGKKLLKETKKSLESDEVAVVDAGFTIREMLESGIDRFVLREAINCTVRRNEFPKRKGKGRPPEYGDIVRPLSRSYKGKRLEATTPDSSGRFLYSGRLICYQAWHNLVPRTTKVDTANRTYSIYVIQDPAYNTPLVLATVMTLQPETIYLVYLERWPVEPPGRLRRVLSSALFPTPDQLDPDFRKKASVSHHFPKGVLAHRRLNAAA